MKEFLTKFGKEFCAALTIGAGIQMAIIGTIQFLADSVKVTVKES